MAGNGEIRERIYEAAKDLFYENGFAKTTLRMIAERADANSAMVSYYFGSKTQLASEIIGDYYAAARRAGKVCLDELCPNASLYLESALDNRITTQNFSDNQKLLRFYLELDETNFYVDSDIVAVDIFRQLFKSCAAQMDEDKIRAAAISISALANALISARANGMIHYSDEEIVRSIMDYHGVCLQIPQDETERVLAESKELAKRIRTTTGPGFEVRCEVIGE